MKINSITTSAIHPKSHTKMRSMKTGRECAYERDNFKTSNNDKINTTIKMKNSDGRVSFKGKLPTPFIHKFAKLAADNPLVAEALFALTITCGARPLTIMATANTPEEKEKCTYQAAKSVSTGVVGLGMSAIVGSLISPAAKEAQKRKAFEIPDEILTPAKQNVEKGVKQLKVAADYLEKNSKSIPLVEHIRSIIKDDKIDLDTLRKGGKDAEKVLVSSIETATQNSKAVKLIKEALKNQRILDNYESTAKNIIDKFFQPVFMPVRATITIALVPVILGALGIKKGNKAKAQGQAQAQEQKINPYTMLNHHICQTNNEKELFKSFAGVANHEN